MITFVWDFSACSLDCLAAVLASSLARSLESLASWSVEMVRLAVCCSNASSQVRHGRQGQGRGRDRRSRVC
jgi:hypothetical protein